MSDWTSVSMQVMVHIAQKLEQLHGAGWVHRDLKPENAIWLPSSNSWTLIDFGSAAQAGALLCC
jgi:serine/threonine protein kinase